MDMKVLKERETPLLSRKRITFEVNFNGVTPSRIQVRDAVAKKVSADKDLVIIKHVYNRYGIEQAKVIAHVYDKKEDLMRYEEKVLIDKHVEKKAEEAAA